MAYNIYTAEYHGGKLNHIAIFVRDSDAPPEASGRCYHVTGSVLAGMKFEIRERESPLVAPDHAPDTMLLVGTVSKDKIARFEDVCNATPPPEPQLKLNCKPKDPSKPLRRCGEWVKEVLAKLKDGILLEAQKTDDGEAEDVL